VARALTADEQARYPWASRIDDYVPVGRIRKLAVACSGAGLGAVMLGMFISLILNENIHHAVTMRHAPTAVGMYVGMALTAVGAAVGIVTGVQALANKANSLLWWTVAAVVPAIFVYLVIWPALR